MNGDEKETGLDEVSETKKFIPWQYDGVEALRYIIDRRLKV